MKPKYQNIHQLSNRSPQPWSSKLSFAFAACLVAQAGAANLYWDANADTAGAGTAPSGTWDAGTFWNSTAAGDTTVPGAWNPGDKAIFSAGADAVDPFTVDTTGSVSVGEVIFEEGLPTISGTGALNFTGQAVFSGGGTGIVAVNVSGAGLNKIQGGSTTLSGTTTVTGDLSVNGGILKIAGPLTVSGNLRSSWNGSAGTQNLVIETGANITTSRFIMADWYYVNDTVSHTGGTLNVMGSNDSNGTGASFLLGHWGYGSTTVYNLSGGTVNAPNARMSLGWDRGNVQFNQSGGTANLRGINLDNGRGNAASYNLTGGRLNLGVGGINNQANKSINAGGATIGATASWTSAKPINLTGTVTVDTLDAVDGSTARNITFAGGANGSGSIIKNGAGTLSLGGTSGYTGDTVVNAGRFMAGSVLGGNIIANAGTVIGSGSLTAPGTSQVNNVESNGATFNFRVGGAASDQLDALDINVVSASQVSLSPAGPLLVNDEFVVVKYETLSGLGFAGMSAAALPNPHYSASLTHDATAKEIKLQITGAESILWTGSASTAWDINGTSNWEYESDSTVTKFYNDDVITFDDTATTGNVVLSTTVQPASVLFVNSTLDYNVSGSGSIAGSLGITKAGSASLTFESNQGYQGVTNILNGTLVVKGTLANASITNAGVLVFDLNSNQSISYPITGAGSIVKRGTGTLTIPNNKNFSGGVVIENGNLVVSAGGWYVNPFGSTNNVVVEPTGVLTTTGAHSLGVDQNNFHVKGTLTLGSEQYISNLQMTGGLVQGPGALRTWGGTMTFNASDSGSVISAPVELRGQTTFNVADGAAADDLLISGVISVDNILNKNGDGVLRLTGANTYNANTVVNAGVLEVTGSALHDSKRLTINGGKVDPSGATETVDTLYFGAVQQAAGTWGASGSGAANINDTYFTGTGVVNVITGPPTAYDIWATATGATGGKSADPDGDGVSNLMEFATNANPTSAASGAKVYAKLFAIGGEDVLTYTVAVRTGATFANGATDAVKQEASVDLIKYTVEASNELGVWNVVDVDELDSTTAAAVQAAITPTLPTLDSGWSWHTFRTDGDVAVDSRDFIRLQVTEVTP